MFNSTWSSMVSNFSRIWIIDELSTWYNVEVRDFECTFLIRFPIFISKSYNIIFFTWLPPIWSFAEFNRNLNPRPWYVTACLICKFFNQLIEPVWRYRSYSCKTWTYLALYSPCIDFPRSFPKSSNLGWSGKNESISKIMSLST